MMKIYILSHTSVGNCESEFYVDGVFSSIKNLNAAKSRIKDEMPQIVDTRDGTINPETNFEVSEHELDKEFYDSGLSYWCFE